MGRGPAKKIEDITKGFAKNNYICSKQISTAVYLANELEKAILIEDLATDGKSKVVFIEALRKFNIKVSDLHTIHVEESGNKSGKPIIFLHGGPGGGIEPIYRQYFNVHLLLPKPKLYKIVLSY